MMLIRRGTPCDRRNKAPTAERRNGFDRVIQERFKGLTVLPTLESHNNKDRTARIIRRTFATHSDIAGVYVMGSEAAMALQTVADLCDTSKLVIVAHERTPTTEAMLRDDTVDALVG